MLTINDRADFGFAINAAIRIYREEPTEENFQVICHSFENYMKYIDQRTLGCSIRDLQPEAFCTYAEAPENQKGKYDKLVRNLILEYLNRIYEKKLKQTRCYDLLLSEAQGLECIAAPYRKATFASQQEFLDWFEHSSREYAGFVDEDPISIADDFVDDFNRICIMMVKYSAGRLTAMPNITAFFLKSNFNSIASPVTAEKILKIIEKYPDPCWFDIRSMLETI